MKTKPLVSALERLDRHGAWLFSAHQLRLFFPDETLGSFRKSLSLHAAEDVFIRSAARGFYVNPRARSLPAEPIKAMVDYLRPWHLNYVSLESILGGTDSLSQMPSRLVVVSTGRSSLITTCFGDIEFVRCTLPRQELLTGLVHSGSSGLLHATHERAVADYARFNRAHDLLNHTA